jgi:hypothetical protein
MVEYYWAMKVRLWKGLGLDCVGIKSVGVVIRDQWVGNECLDQRSG